ncbi:MAG: glycosyltransferase [Eubacterium sp.]|nr:glycosyltransferase [Eubacterium sp.]
MKKKKVLMLASVASMIDQFNMPNIRLMLEQGYEVHVACNFIEGNTCDDRRICSLKKTLRQMQVKQHQWDCPRKAHSARACLKAYWQLLGLMERHCFAWVHCQSPIGGALARAAAHQKGVRVIYTAHGFHFYKGAPLKNWLFYYPVEKLLARWTDVLITVNREDYLFAKRHLRAGKVYRIPGVGIVMERFCRQTEEVSVSIRKAFCRTYKIPYHAQVVLSVGELSRRKNHQAVLQAAAHLLQEDVYYIICGQGALDHTLRKQAKKLGIWHYIRMPGYLEDVKSLYENADLFVFPSLQEGLPVALMEAMAAGLACVASDIRGNRELIDSRGGGLISLKHPRELREKLQELLDDAKLRKSCGSYNQKKIEAYSLKNVQERMRQIYGQMVGATNQKEAKRKSPTISVVMAVYNAADGQALTCAVSSICRQSYADWELLICDDGSKDRTWEILKRLAAADSRIRLLRLAYNCKAGYARNQCIRAARGRYVAVMDADDISAEKRLERQFQYLEAHPGIAFVGSRGEFFIRHAGDDGEQYPFYKEPGAAEFLFSLPFVHASLMFRKEALEQVHGYDSSRLAVRAEDYDLLLRLYREGMHGANVDEVLYYIRRDKQQYQRRKYRYRFHEAYIKYRGFCRLGLMPEGILYAAKPLLVGMIPAWLLRRMQRYYYQTKGIVSYEENRDRNIELSDLGAKHSVYGKHL